MAEHDEQDLMRRISARDQKAFVELYERYSSRVHGLTSRILGESMAAEEATQDTFLKLWSRAHQYSSERGSVQVWLLTIARRTALDRLRLDGRRPELSTANDPDEALGSLVDGPTSGQEARWRGLAFAVRSLPGEQRRAVELAYYEGLSQSEIADFLGWPLGTVKSRLRAAMERLRREWLSGEGG